MNIQDKVVIVTGASDGIGKAAAKLLGEKGAKVVLAARSKDKLDALAKELPDAFVVSTDMRNAEDIKSLIEKTIEHYGHVDILVNNAGQGIYGAVASVDVGEYEDVIALNILGPLRAMQAVIPQMKQQGGGVIVNVSSMVSKNYFPMLGAYASTKYALNALSLTARKELEQDHIIVSVLHPRMTATSFGKNSRGVTLYPDRPAGTAANGMQVDSAESVAEKLLELIESGEAEAQMP